MLLRASHFNGRYCWPNTFPNRSAVASIWSCLWNIQNAQICLDNRLSIFHFSKCMTLVCTCSNHWSCGLTWKEVKTHARLQVSVYSDHSTNLHSLHRDIPRVEPAAPFLTNNMSLWFISKLTQSLVEQCPERKDVQRVGMGSSCRVLWF